MDTLKKKKCVPCEGGVVPLTVIEIDRLSVEIPEWKVATDEKSIFREFVFDDFAKALSFVDRIGVIAQEEWHHPDIHLAWGRVGVTFSTHAIKGLSENDFIMAAKVDDAFGK